MCGWRNYPAPGSAGGAGGSAAQRAWTVGAALGGVTRFGGSGDRTGTARAHESARIRHWRAAAVSSGVWPLERVGRALVDGLANLPIAAGPTIAPARLSRTLLLFILIKTALAADERRLTYMHHAMEVEAIHPFGGPAYTDSALNIRVHLRLTAFSRLIFQRCVPVRTPGRMAVENPISARLDGARQFAVRLAFLDARTLVVRLLALARRSRAWPCLSSSTAPAHERVTFTLDRTDQLADFSAVQQQFAFAHRSGFTCVDAEGSGETCEPMRKISPFSTTTYAS